MSISEVKETVADELKKVEEKIAYITKLKDEAVENLVRQKEALQLQEYGATTPGEIEKIDEEIAEIKRQKKSLIGKQMAIYEELVPFQELQGTLKQINKELVAIEDRHSMVMAQLDNKRNFLVDRLKSIMKIDSIAVALEDSVRDTTETYNTELDRLRAERQALLMRTDMSPSEMQAALREIDAVVEQLETAHIATMSKLSQQMSELKNTFTKDFSASKRDELLEETRRLLESRKNASPSEIIRIDKRIAELGLELEQLEDFLTIRANRNEGLAELLEKRGFTLLENGKIMTGSGRILTIEEARALGMLEGIEDELMETRGIQLTASGRILTGSGRLLTKSEAERMGLLDGINLDEMYDFKSPSESISSSSATTMSGISSSDVHYLKTVLGRPLALALAEITAKQPRDPIHYLGHWLYKYRYNQEIDEEKKTELTELLQERERVARAQLRERAETDAKDVLMDLLGRVDNVIQKHDIESELRRIQDEAAILEAENEELEEEAKDTLGVYDGPTTGQKLK